MSAADEFLSTETHYEAEPEDPLRPKPVRGRYLLPRPSGPKAGTKAYWTRVTNFTKLFEDTYLLEQWKQRNAVKGFAIMALSRPALVEDAAGLHVKADKPRLNRMVDKAFVAAETYALADEGTALHKSTEDVDHAHGDLNVATERHQVKMALYRQTLRENNIAIVPDLIERVTVSEHYQVAGKFDRIVKLADGSYCMADVKTNDSLDFAVPSIAAQLECYVNGVNNTGIWDSQRYDTSIKVREDFGLILYLPSTRDECRVIRVELEAGRQINAVNLAVKGARTIKGGSISRSFLPNEIQALNTVDTDALWRDKLNNCDSRDDLIAVVARAKAVSQWNGGLADYARGLAAAIAAMGS